MSEQRIQALVGDQLGWTKEEITQIQPLYLTPSRAYEGSTAYQVRGRSALIVKLGNVEQEVTSYGRLAKILPKRIPSIWTDGTTFIIREFIDGQDLCSLVINDSSDNHASKTFATILNEFTRIWENGCRVNTGCVPPFDRMLERLPTYKKSLSQLVSLDQLIIANGQNYPQLTTIFAEVEKHYQQSQPRIFLTHGDPWPGNIIILPNNDYLLIDGHCASHDWVEDLVRLSQWRKFYCVEGEARYSNNGGEIRIDFSTQYPAMIHTLEDLGQGVGNQFADSINDPSWLKRYWLIASLAYLRDAARSKSDPRWTKNHAHRLIEIGLALECFDRYQKLKLVN